MQTRLYIMVLVLIACLRTAHAHSGDGQALFVAIDGADAGECIDASRPCRTIGYALRRLGKGGEIRVAAGQYSVTDRDDLFQLLNGSIEINGGFGKDFREAARNPTVLAGVPAEFAGTLVDRGFQVVADNKATDRGILQSVQQKLGQHEALKSSIAATPCVNGNISGMACMNVDLLSHVGSQDISARPGDAADVWGFVDMNTNREYAIVGFDIGTAIFDVTDAENPREVGFIDGQRTLWRDIKVYQFWDAGASRFSARAYITTDGSTDGLFVIDLSDLPQQVSRVAYGGDFLAAHNVYLAGTDFGTGLPRGGAAPAVVVAGSNNGSGPFRVYSVTDPDAPGFRAMPGSGRSDYTHDAASMIITDARKDTQCVNGTSYCEVLFDFNESTVDTWDITNAASPVRLNRTVYPNTGYVHSGWPSEDGQYVFVQDELDERDRGLNTTLRAFAVSNLATPSFAGQWTGPTAAIDHNGFVRGNRYYMSNYSRGLTILDITNVTNMEVVGRLDTYPGSDATAFVGAWGAYPFFHSGNVAISDIDSGFYMVADRTLDVPEGRLAFSSRSYAATEGAQLTITVRRLGGGSGPVSTAYEIVPATAGLADILAASGTLNWSDGDTADKAITIDIASDADNGEGLERFLVQLIAPTGGATLDTNRVASVYIGEPGAAAVVEFDRAVVPVAERGFATAVVVVKRHGSAAAAASVDFAVTAGSATAGSDFQGPTSGTISWAAGDADPKWIELDITDDGTVEGEEFIELTLGNATGANIGGIGASTVLIGDGTGVNRAPNASAGASQTVNGGATVSLNGSASNDPDGDALGYQWTQAAGTPVTIVNADSATASFTAPTGASDLLLRFELTVSDGLLQDTAAVSVTVRQPSAGGSGGGSADWWLLIGLMLARVLRSRRARS
ncbi:MAG: choice-of-anchor B family protein [Gammaproteobacteria bacterium]|nr:choice-of-anchor B family protein [Gammaproteobacteria bacterium]